MLLAGVYTRGAIKFGFQIIFGRIKTMFTLSKIEDSVVSDAVTTQVLTARFKKERADLIVAQVITSPAGKVSASYGDSELIKEFISNLTSKTRFSELKKLKHSAEIVDTSFKISIYHIVENNVTITKYRFLEYDEVASSKTEYYTKRGSVRTLNELKELYDLSWILNEDDSLKKDYRTICTAEELDWVIDNVKNATELAFDVETTGLNFFYQGGKTENCDRLVGICLSWKVGQAVYIPLESYKFECLTAEEVVPKLFPHLTRIAVDGANLMFDIKVAYHYGYKLTCGFDTMQAEFDLDPTGSRGHKSLKEMSRYYLGDETLELDEVLGGPVDGRMIPYLDKDVITIYGCADAEYVLKLKHHITPYLQHMRVCTKLDFKMITVCAIAEYYGNRVDMEALKILSDVNKRDFAMVDKTLREYLRVVAKNKIILETMKACNCDMNDKSAYEYFSSDEQVNKMVDIMTTMEGKNGERIPFNFHSKDDLDIVLFKILGYPTPKVKKRIGKKESISKDDAYLNNLALQTLSNSTKFMTEDLLSSINDYGYEWVSNKEKVLLSKDQINNCKYPFAIMLMMWRKLDKRQSSFYDRLQNLSSNGYYLTENNMTAADTARIINVAQTLQGYIKRLIIPFPNKYEIIFDAMQIEFRVMIGLASNYWETFTKSLGPKYDDIKSISIKTVSEKLNIPWADYHREGGCILVGKKPATMEKSDRSKVKGPHFAVPYGGSAYTIAKDRLTGVTDPVKQHKIIQETDDILSTWKNKMYPLYKFLEYKRDQAITPVTNISKLPPKLQEDVKLHGGNWGYVDNALGRRRYYNLNYEKTARAFIKGEPDLIHKVIAHKLEEGEELSNSEKRIWKNYLKETEKVVKALIRRSAGNYPIQSLAREYFVLMMTSLTDALHRDGYYGMGADKDKVILNMLVHDEGHLQIDYSIHPYKMYNYIIKNCMLDIKGYPRIYCGISICKNWYDGKEDLYEAPVEFVYDMAKAYEENPEKFDNDDWQSDPQGYVHKHIQKWIHDYTNKFVASNSKDGVLDLVRFREENDNYFISVKVGMYSPKFKNKEDDISFTELLMLLHNENPDLIIRTEKREFKASEYKFEFDKPKVIEQKSVDDSKESIENQTDLFNELSDITSTDDDINLDELFDTIDVFSASELDIDVDDSEYKEQENINCYWIASDNENISELVPSINNLNMVPVFEEEIEEVEPMKFKRFFDITGILCLNLTGVDRKGVELVSNYLKSKRDDNGQKLLYVIDTVKKFLPYKVSGVTADDLRIILEP